MYKAGGQGLEQLVIMFLSRCGKGGKGSAVEAVFKGDNGAVSGTLFVLRIFACDLDGSFVGLRTRIAEEYLFHPCFFAQKLRKTSAGLCVIEIGGVLELAELIGDGL